MKRVMSQKITDSYLKWGIIRPSLVKERKHFPRTRKKFKIKFYGKTYLAHIEQQGRISFNKWFKKFGNRVYVGDTIEIYEIRPLKEYKLEIRRRTHIKSNMGKLKKDLRRYKKILTDLNNDTGGVVKNNLVGDLGNFYASKKFGIKLNANPTQTGYDGTKGNYKYEIKAFYERKGKIPRFGRFVKSTANFDFLMAIILDENYQLKKAYKIPSEVVFRNIHKKYLILNFTQKFFEKEKGQLKILFTKRKNNPLKQKV